MTPLNATIAGTVVMGACTFRPKHLRGQ